MLYECDEFDPQAYKLTSNLNNEMWLGRKSQLIGPKLTCFGIINPNLINDTLFNLPFPLNSSAMYKQIIIVLKQSHVSVILWPQRILENMDFKHNLVDNTTILC
jgi:hypothetical protein